MKEIVFMYHDVFINKPTESGLASEIYKLKVDEFEGHLSMLQELTDGETRPILTFDDGGSSFYEPISFLLDKYGFKGRFFIATKYINTVGFMGREQIKDLYKRGHLIGSHSHSHPENFAALDYVSIKNEWEQSVHILSDIINSPITIASIPNGYQSHNVLFYAKQSGITDLYTSCPTLKTTYFDTMRLHGRFVILSSTGINGLRKIIYSSSYRFNLYLKNQLLMIPKIVLGKKYEPFKNYLFGFKQ